MPNWSEGTLKVRGTKDNLKKFVLEGMQQVDFIGNVLEPLELDESYSVKLSDEAYHFYIKGTTRGFVEQIEIDMCFLNEEREKPILMLDVKFSWAVNVEELSKISKKYDVDLKIYTFEKGMEFNQDIEIIKGKIVKDVEMKFDDYEWDCICPSLGG